MAGELHDNAEKQTLAPVGVQGDAASLSQTTQTLFSPLSGIRAASELPQSLDFGSPTDIYGKDNVIAQNYQDVRQNGLRTDIVRVAMPSGATERLWNPYRGDITSKMNEVPEQAWNQAFEAFPQFKRAGLSEQQATQLMQGIMRNELYNFDQMDNADELAIRRTGKPAPIHRNPDDATVGYSQISINGVKARETEFPDQLGKFKGHEIAALEDPKSAPLLIAATLAHNIKMYENHRIPVTEQSLAYSYNPDVKDQSGHNKLLPTASDLNSSNHVKNVMHQLAIIRGTEKPKPGEL